MYSCIYAKLILIMYMCPCMYIYASFKVKLRPIDNHKLGNNYDPIGDMT